MGCIGITIMDVGGEVTNKRSPQREFSKNKRTGTTTSFGEMVKRDEDVHQKNVKKKLCRTTIHKGICRCQNCFKDSFSNSEGQFLHLELI